MQTHQKSLTEDLDKMLSGCMERLALALMRPPFLFLSMEVHDALSAQLVDERVLVEILCTKTNAEIRQINEAYKHGELKLWIFNDPTFDLIVILFLWRVRNSTGRRRWRQNGRNSVFNVDTYSGV